LIIANIHGGLGNQMFQYAAGCALAKRLNQPLRLDVSSFTNYQLHNGFELTRIFAGVMELATPADMQRVLKWRAIPRIKRLLSRSELSIFRDNKLVVEPHFQYWEKIKQVTPNAYVVGYWQSEKYFKIIEPIIRADFVFRGLLTEKNQQVGNEIAQSNSVSIHVRRGDYVKNIKTMAIHGLCSLDYYREAIQYIFDRVEQPRFFIFSDDIPWVKENLIIDSPCHYVDHNNGAESWCDMRLMSLCQHHIIANSSFSWWGAWLNPSSNKMVIAPRRWFANQTDVSDLIPQDWVTL
jgi:hypothetical protein